MSECRIGSCRTLPCLVRAPQASFKDPRTLKAKYRVTVMTSDMRGAGTDADVFVQLFGDEAETGRINLDNPGRCVCVRSGLSLCPCRR